MKIIKRSNDLPLFDQFFDGFFRDEPVQWMNRNVQINAKEKVNISESDDLFQIELLAPGYRKEDLHIEVDGDLLNLKAERQESNSNEEANYLRREFRIGNFERQFRLPKGKVDTDNIAARFEDGVLFVSLPKREEVKRAVRAIEIN